MYKLGAIVLAAGLSSRMKAFKPLLPVGDKTMILRVVSMMKDAGADIIAVITGFNREALEDSLKHENLIFVHNVRYFETQMFESLLLGFDAIGAKCERLLICPGDVPLVSPNTVSSLLSSMGLVVRPVYKGAPGHPVLLSKEIIPFLMEYKGAGGLRGAVEAMGIDITEFETNDRGVIMDADSPNDYRVLIEMLASSLLYVGNN